MADEIDQAPAVPTTQPAQEAPKFNVPEWEKKFKASEKVMKNEFLPGYQIAKSRIRSDRDIKNRNSKTKRTHENVSLAYSIGQNYVNSVYFKSPDCNLTAREEEDSQKVELTEVQTNDWIKDKKIKKTIKRIVWDAYTGGLGVRFMDHEYEDTQGPDVMGYEKKPMVDPATGQVVEVDDETKPIFNRIILKNEVVFKRIRPDLVRFPKGFDLDNFQESPWIGFDVILPLSEVQGNTDWDEAARNAIEGEKYSKLSSVDKETNSDEGDDLYAKISYLFIKPQSQMEPFKLAVFCGKYSEGTLKETDFDKGTIGYPIKFLYSNPLDDDHSYPVGDCWLFEAQLAAVETWWRKLVDQVSRSNPKRLYDQSALSDKEILALKANNNLEWAGCENKDRRDIRSFITDVQAAPMNPSVEELYAGAMQILDRVAPKSSLSQGSEENPQKPGTATAAKIISTGDMIDVEARIDDVRDFIIDIVLDYAGILEKSLVAPIPVRVGEGDASQVIQADKSMFTSKIKVDVDVESMQAMNKDMHRKQLLDALSLLTSLEPILNKIGQTLNPVFWIEKIMETLGIRNVEKGIMELPPQMAIDPKTGQPLPPAPGPQPPPVDAAEPNPVAMEAAQEPQVA